MPRPPVQLEALLLPDTTIGTRCSQLRFGVWAHGAPRALGARLHDRTGRRAHSTDVSCLPQLAHQAVYPTLELRAGQGRVPLGLLHVTQTDRDVEHRVEAVETLLHVAILSWPIVELQSILWRFVGRKKERADKEVIDSEQKRW